MRLKDFFLFLQIHCNVYDSTNTHQNVRLKNSILDMSCILLVLIRMFAALQS